MRIVRVTSFYGPVSSTQSTVIRELGMGYLRAGHEFVVISPGATYSRTVTSAGTLITVPLGDLTAARAPARPDGERVRSTLVATVVAIGELLDELHPDRLEVADRLTLRALGDWANAHGVPSIAVLDELPAPWVLRSGATDRYQNVVVSTERARVAAAALAPTRVIRVPNGVDLEVFNPLRWSGDVATQLRDGAEVLFVLAAGPDSPGDSGPVTMAMRNLLRRSVDAQLVVLDAEMTEHDRAIVLASADVFIAIGSPQTVVLDALEALASGTPVIAPTDSAVMEILSGDAGLGTEQGAAALTNALSEILTVRIEDRRTAARLAAAEFPWSQTVVDMLDLHHSADAAPVAELAMPIA
jgi:alpha-1,6-mannosyltransferase